MIEDDQPPQDPTVLPTQLDVERLLSLELPIRDTKEGQEVPNRDDSMVSETGNWSCCRYHDEYTLLMADQHDYKIFHAETPAAVNAILHLLEQGETKLDLIPTINDIETLKSSKEGDFVVGEYGQWVAFKESGKWACMTSKTAGFKFREFASIHKMKVFLRDEHSRLDG